MKDQSLSMNQVCSTISGTKLTRVSCQKKRLKLWAEMHLSTIGEAGLLQISPDKAMEKQRSRSDVQYKLDTSEVLNIIIMSELF